MTVVMAAFAQYVSFVLFGLALVCTMAVLTIGTGPTNRDTRACALLWLAALGCLVFSLAGGAH
jgi:hypothetical protein